MKKPFLILLIVAVVLVAAQPTRRRRQNPPDRTALAISPSATALWHQAFRLGLRDLGWVEGKNISIEYRYAEGRQRSPP